MKYTRFLHFWSLFYPKSVRNAFFSRAAMQIFVNILSGKTVTLYIEASEHFTNAATPNGKVVQLLSDLQAKIMSEGVAAKAKYEEHSDWCEDLKLKQERMR